MVRRAHLYPNLFGLICNPFPDHAIAVAGDDLQNFYRELHPDISRRMARAFVGGLRSRRRSIAFLWSLGEGENARGYGKTTYLLWFVECVNQDKGQTVLRMAGDDHETSRLFAAYGAFNTAEGLSFNNILFDIVRNIVVDQQNTVKALRDRAMNEGLTSELIYQNARRLLERTADHGHDRFLQALCNEDPQEGIDYMTNPEIFQRWHRAQYGLRLFRTASAYLRALGISHIVVLMDQLEDFASWSTPAYKLQRDFEKLAYCVHTDKLLSGHIRFVLTMHPRAAVISSRHWANERLGEIAPDQDQSNTVVIGSMKPGRFIELTRKYLDNARGLDSRSDVLRPFTEESLSYVCSKNKGRPGDCLRALHVLLECSLDEGLTLIDRETAERMLGEDSPEAE
jgi:hypothetical protein